jgi:hypothetical protein
MWEDQLFKPPQEVLDNVGKPCCVCAKECIQDKMAVLNVGLGPFPVCSPECLTALVRRLNGGV